MRLEYLLQLFKLIDQKSQSSLNALNTDLEYNMYAGFPN